MVITGRVFQGLSLVILQLLVTESSKRIIEHAFLGWLKTKQSIYEHVWLHIVPQCLEVSEDVNVDFLDARNRGTTFVNG